jgi:hypothetical protein
MSSYHVGLTCPYGEEPAHEETGDGGAIEVDLMDDTTVEFIARARINVTCPVCRRTFETVLD